MESFRSITDLKILESEIIEKKSRFLSFAKYVPSSEQAEMFIRETRKKYSDAKHIVFAYRLLSVSRASDDGEPSGTAGRPILDVIQKLDLYNIVVVVVRYFGGTKLGAGPLLRTYSKSASEVLKTDFRLYEKCFKAKISVSFQKFEELLKLASKNFVDLKNIEFSEQVSLDVIFPQNFDINVPIETKTEIFYSFKGV